MAQRPVCPLCGKRRPERFCPAKGEKICAVCCGTEREVTLDCPSDCSYLIAARRYEEEHRKPLVESEMPFPDILFSPDVIYEHQPLVTGFGFAIVKSAAAERGLVDRDVLEALTALAETYRTLVSGIYYEKPPSALFAKGLYDALGAFLQDYRKQEAAQPGFRTIKDAEILYALVFLSRMARSRASERPRARRFIDFLRAQFPAAQQAQKEESRIVMP
jgi:hypothetical protein